MIGLVSLLTVASSCSKSSTEPLEPSGPAGITGRITSVVAEGAFRGTIKVEADPTSTTIGPKSVVTVTNSTIVILKTRDEGEFRSLAVGQWVRVWYTGAIVDTYPTQGIASTVAIDSLGIGVSN